jgi:deoxyribonuclease V
MHWPTTPTEAIAVQEQLRDQVDTTGPGPSPADTRYVAGLVHPRRFGLACHLGVLTDLPSIGIAKTAFVGTYDPPGADRGSHSDLMLDDAVVGAVVRTQTEVKPLFVSVGHRINLATAIAHTLHLTPQYRLPETTRAADHACRTARQELLDD